MNEIIIVYFWEHVEKQSCWNWTGFLDKTGLPIIRKTIDGRFQEFYPRRISLQIAGKVLDSSAQVQPLVCKNKLCVNPDHLVSGDEARFWAKVQKLPSDCWIWTASHDKNMYGKFCVSANGKCFDIRAHQYSWQLYTGRPVPAGIQLCHTCDHPYCVNPNHLFLGTSQDNTQDKVNKNRQAKGELHGMHKLTEAQVKEIHQLYQTGNYTQKELADQFHVVKSVIGDIIHKKIWRHV